jgi:hypothetical protein
VAAAYATNGPYLGARADVPYWKVDVHPNEFSMSYILVGYTLDTNYMPGRGSKPPADLTNQIAVGLVVSPFDCFLSIPQRFQHRPSLIILFILFRLNVYHVFPLK